MRHYEIVFIVHPPSIMMKEVQREEARKSAQSEAPVAAE